MRWTVGIHSFLSNVSVDLGMYEGDPYGDEIEGGDEDKNDGLNALVRRSNEMIINLSDIELAVGHRVQQGH